MSWDIALNEVLPRREVHRRYGGSRQNGIATSATTPNILIFSNDSGSRFGYNYDGWQSDGLFHYTGEGQEGDQEFTRGNAAILGHLDSGRSLRVFKSGKKGAPVTYLGEFQLADDAESYYPANAPDRNHNMRTVIVFRFHPLGVDSPATPAPAVGPPRTRVSLVPLESHKKETFQTNPKREPTQAEKREAALVERYGAWLRSQGHRVERNEIFPKGSTRPLYSDLYDVTTRELVEAKGTSTRVNIRAAIGQLFDYRRYVSTDTIAMLLPAKPIDDLIDLILGSGIACVHETAPGKFERLDPATP